MRHKEFWIALGIGALGGGIAALLYAPQSGATTRKKLRRGVEDIGDSLEDAADYLKHQAEHLSKEAQKLIEASKANFGEALDAAGDVVKSANKAAAKTVSRIV